MRSFRMSCSPRWSRGSLLLPSWFRGDVLGRMGRRRCRDATGRNKFYGGFCLRAPPSNHGHLLRTVEGYRPLYLPVVNLAPRWEGRMVGVRNERQTHLPTPLVWTAPLRPPYRRPPAESSHGCYGRRAFFRNWPSQVYALSSFLQNFIRAGSPIMMGEGHAATWAPNLRKKCSYVICITGFPKMKAQSPHDKQTSTEKHPMACTRKSLRFDRAT